jgi:hypothetical protein
MDFSAFPRVGSAKPGARRVVRRVARCAALPLLAAGQGVEAEAPSDHARGASEACEGLSQRSAWWGYPDPPVGLISGVSRYKKAIALIPPIAVVLLFVPLRRSERRRSVRAE